MVVKEECVTYLSRESKNNNEDIYEQFLLWLSGCEPDQYHKDMGVIPGPAQWVKDLVLP